MNSRTPFSAIVLLLVALAASVWLSSKLAKARANQCVTATAGQKLVHAGLGKFLSHLDWMRLIQLRGSMDTVGPEKAELLARKYDQITNEDPMFADAYEEGALDLGWQDPEKSLALLDKAMGVSRLNDWKIPFMAGFICKTRLKNPNRAIAYIEGATKQPNCPGYVYRYLINLKSEVANGDPAKTLDLWVEYYDGGPQQMTTGLRRPKIATSVSSLVDSDRHMALTRISQISSKIIAEAQASMARETDAEKKKALQDQIDKVQKVINQVYGGIHICTKCFRPYSAGDNFCVFDGTKIVPYGVCPKDGTVVREAYCQKCGTKVN